ncbi:MAG TPA: HAD family hydrolase [Planctomycetota bacterium]|nr:HAD family hydrolase [Planctomycetota bacterium]
MTDSLPVVFLLDVDNTLLDNDRVISDLRRFLSRTLGEDRQETYWTIFETLRKELGYADYLGALQRYRAANPRGVEFALVSQWLLDYHFANRLYPGSLDAIEHLARFGQTVILSDGDVVFQPRKIERAGLEQAMEGRVLVYIHKEHELDEVERRYPARHYVLVDDKIRILTAAKKVWGSRLTTVFPRQGHYANDPKEVASYPPADVTIERIGDLVQHDLETLLRAGQGRTSLRSP